MSRSLGLYRVVVDWIRRLDAIRPRPTHFNRTAEPTDNNAAFSRIDNQGRDRERREKIPKEKRERERERLTGGCGIAREFVDGAEKPAIKPSKKNTHTHRLFIRYQIINLLRSRLDMFIEVGNTDRAGCPETR